jgi:hypothetical protein
VSTRPDRWGRTGASGVFTLFAALLAAPGAATAARPLVTDDARVVDPGACQLETWTRIGDAGDEFWALPACSVIANLEMTAGVGVLPAERGGSPEHPVVQLQAKTLFPGLGTNRVGVGLAVGTVLRAHDQLDELNQDRLGEFYAYVPATVALLPERALVHLNLGARYRGEGAGGFMIWGVGTEVIVLGPFTAVAEVYGDAPGPSFTQAGLRISIVPDHVQIDATYGRRIPDGSDEEWATVGLRLISPELFHPLGELSYALPSLFAR